MLFTFSIVKRMKADKRDLIKVTALAFGLISIVTILGIYVFPNYIFVNANYKVCISGVVDHKKISESYLNGELMERYTVSVKLFEDDPINNIKNGETIAYFISYDNWLMIEWGDTVKLELKPDFQAELTELYPALKLPQWHAISGSNSPLSIEAIADKTVYTFNEKPAISIAIKNDPTGKGWIDSPIPISLTLLRSPRLYLFIDGKIVYSSPSDSIADQIKLDPENEIIKNIELDLKEIGDHNLEGIYYIRIHLGHFSENREITLTCTTMIEVQTE